MNRVRVRLLPRAPLQVKQRVVLSYDRERHGTIVRLGEEQSEVRWDNNRVTCYYQNERLRPE